MGEQDVERLMQEPGIIRNRLKIKGIIANAKAYLAITENISFRDYIWQFTDHKTIINSWQNYKDAPVSSAESVLMAKTLKKAGFKFVGETICYAYMQAVGMVNDHTVTCHCYQPCCEEARR